MFEKIMPKQTVFFDYFEQHAKNTLDAIRILHEGLQNLEKVDKKMMVQKIEQLEGHCDDITHKAVDRLRNSFITPFERDEIRYLVSTLDEVIDHVEAAAHRIELFEIKTSPEKLTGICGILLLAQEQIVALVNKLRFVHEKQGQEYDKHCLEINRLENQSDQLHRAGIAALFYQGADPLEVIKYKELYEILETAMDRCEDVANVVEGIFIEHAG